MHTRRALAVCVGVVLFGALGFGWSISGEWGTRLQILPDVGLDSASLTLTGSFNGWEITSSSVFYGAPAYWPWWLTDDEKEARQEAGEGFAVQAFTAKGMLGFAEIEASLAFSPVDRVLVSVEFPSFLDEEHPNYVEADPTWTRTIPGPSYQSASLSASMDLLGVELGLRVTHKAWHVETQQPGDFGTEPAKWNLPGLVERYQLGELLYCIVDTTDPDYDRFDPDTWKIERAFTTNRVLDLAALELAKPTFWLGPSDSYMDAMAKAVYDVFDPQTHAVLGYWVEDTRERIFIFPAYMTYTFDAKVDPFYAEVMFDDMCTGIQFHSALVGFTDLALCCGITFDAEISFLKSGFDSLEITLADMFTIMDLWTYDITITYGTDYKSVGVDIEFAELVPELCVEFFIESEGLFDLTLEGFAITCTLDDCSSVTFATGFPYDVEVTEAITRYCFEGQWKDFLVDDPATNEGLRWTQEYIILPDGMGMIYAGYGYDFVNSTPVEGSEWLTNYWYPEPHSIELTYVGREATLPEKFALRSGTRGKARVVFDKSEYYGDWRVDLVTGETWGIHWFELSYFKVDEIFWFEFEKIDLSFCGPGCCGAEWTTGIRLFFAEYHKFDDYTSTGWIEDKATGGKKAIVEVAYAPINPTLFGLNRIAFEGSIPVMANFMINMDFSYNLYTAETELGLGWTFTF